MTPASKYFIFAALAFIASQLVLAAIAARDARNFRRMAKFERIRTKFAAARGELIWLAAESELSPSSVTFQHLYTVQTMMMRRFDAYPNMSRSFWTQMFDGKIKAEARLHKEVPSWSMGTRRVAEKTADALRHVWIGCMPFGTLLALVRRATAFAGASLFRSLVSWLSRYAPPGMREIREAEQVLRRQLVA